MRQTLELAEFQKVSVLPQVGDSVIYESYLLRRGWRGSFVGARRRWPAWFFAWFFSMTELLLVKWMPSVADCVTAIAVK